VRHHHVQAVPTTAGGIVVAWAVVVLRTATATVTATAVATGVAVAPLAGVCGNLPFVCSVSVPVCLCVCSCVCVWVGVRLSVPVCVLIFLSLCVRVYVFLCLSVCVCVVRVCVFVCVYGCVCVRVCVIVSVFYEGSGIFGGLTVCAGVYVDMYAYAVIYCTAKVLSGERRRCGHLKDLYVHFSASLSARIAMISLKHVAMMYFCFAVID